MKHLLTTLCLAAFSFMAMAQPTTIPQLQPEVFELIDLEVPEMAEVKAHYESGDNTPISAKFVDSHSDNSMKLEVKVGKDKKRILEYTL